MTDLDFDKVDRWFAVTLAPEHSQAYRRSSLRTPELTAFEAGQEAIVTALTGPVPHVAGPAEDVVGGLLHTYLQSLAAGLAQARIVNAEPNGQAGAVDLAAGLITAAAAVGDRAPGTPVVAAAHRAGLMAAESMAAGARFTEVARAALAGITQGWPAEARGASGLSGPFGRPTTRPDGRNEQSVSTVSTEASSRLHLLLVRLLDALVEVNRPPRTGPDVAPCGAVAGENVGVPFSAEVTFTIFGSSNEAAALQNELRVELQATSTEVICWSDGDRHLFHLHTDRPGRAVALAFASSTVFDLEITARQP
jgi:hypothetical protein